MDRIFFPGNIVFCKKLVHCEYYEWVFNIFNEYIKTLKNTVKNPLPRQYGYIA